MRLPRFVVTGVVCGIVLVAAASAWSSHTGVSRSGARAWPDGCPATTVGATTPPGAVAPEVTAIRKQISRVFGRLSSQGAPAWHHAQILGVISLGAEPPTSGWLPKITGLGAYRTRATAACGARTADASALVLLYFGECQLPCAPAFAFVTPTQTGWHLWTSYRV